MSRQLKVEDEIEFVGEADKTDNVWGNFSLERVVWYDDFQGKAIDTTNDYTLTTVNSGTATVTVPHMMTVTTNAKDDDNTEVAMGVEWYPYYDCAMEARFRCDIPTNSAFYIGFNDAVTEGADSLPFEFTDGDITTNSTNGAGLVYDLDCTTKNMYFSSVNNNGDGAVINTIPVVATSLYTVRIELRDIGDTSIDANFYLNTLGKEIDPVNDWIGVEHAAVVNSTALCPYIGLLNRVDAVACTLDVDYLKVWQDRR